MSERTLRGKAAIVGIGETTYYKHGKAPDPEFKLALKAILAACEDAGLDPKEIDGFSSYANDRNDPMRLAAALGVKELRFSNMFWGGGGGGGAGAIANAASAIATGMADVVVVYRALAQGQFARFGRSSGAKTISGEMAYMHPYGAMTPAQRYSQKAMRFMHEHGIKQDALMAISLASYAHAQNNPRAVMHGRPLTEEKYKSSRMITEPFHLFDCCMENDGAAATILVSGERAKDMKQVPAYVLGAASGGPYRAAAWAGNTPTFGSSHFTTVAPHMYEMAGVGPKDVDVVQCYENFTGGVLMSLCEHGLVAPEEANEVLTLDNLKADGGRLPLNTSGGNLAECYMHGLELHIEAARQLRATSPNQVRDAKVALAVAGPMVVPVSTAIYGCEDVL